MLYIDNDVVDVVGSEHMELQALRAGFKSTRVVATCCYSILAVDHDAYCGQKGTPLPGGAAVKRNVVMLITGACKLSGIAPHPFPPSRVIYKCDWDERIDGPVPTIEQYPPSKETSGVQATAWSIPVQNPVGVPLKDSAAWKGKAVRTLGLQERARYSDRPPRHGPGGQPTLEQQLAAWDVAELSRRVSALKPPTPSNGVVDSSGTAAEPKGKRLRPDPPTTDSYRYAAAAAVGGGGGR